MNKKRFLVKWALIGLIIPLILSGVVYGAGVKMSGWNIQIFGFFWISYYALMGLDMVGGIISIFFAYLFIISLNICYYVLLGWLFWQGKTKNKLYYLALPMVVSFVWGGIYLRAW